MFWNILTLTDVPVFIQLMSFLDEKETQVEILKFTPWVVGLLW